jgi:hypothetical protein
LYRSDSVFFREVDEADVVVPIPQPNKRVELEVWGISTGSRDFSSGRMKSRKKGRGKRRAAAEEEGSSLGFARA